MVTWRETVALLAAYFLVFFAWVQYLKLRWQLTNRQFSGVVQRCVVARSFTVNRFVRSALFTTFRMLALIYLFSSCVCPFCFVLRSYSACIISVVEICVGSMKR
jgi:hypothetical protein